MYVDNLTFLKTIFGEQDYHFAHVTSFPDDPSNIPQDRRGICWAGGYFQDTYIHPATNQYFCVSTFFSEAGEKVRRRKVDFRATHVVVLDDVREKLDMSQVTRLPTPTYKLQTSPGSEQWGYILNSVCVDRNKIDNLHDGLISRGLAPNGKDPGMKGVTRYVRLPEGVNTKASKLVQGMPQSCVMLEWNPGARVSLEQLASPFGVDLDAARREGRIDGAADVGNHPILGLGEILLVKGVRSEGRYEVRCPWVGDHTDGADDGAGVFTNEDGSIGFKCHHGSCEHRTGADLLGHIEAHHPGFKREFESWKIMRVFGQIDGNRSDGTMSGGAQEIDFGGDTQRSPTRNDQQIIRKEIDFMGSAPLVGYQDLIDRLRVTPPNEAGAMAYEILKAVDQLDHGSRLTWWNQIRDHMDWSKQDLQQILDQQRALWYEKKLGSFYDEYIFVSEQNQFFNIEKRMWLSPDAFQNTNGHLDMEARTEALMNGRVQKVDRLDYAPGMPKLYTEMGIKYVNGWSGDIEQGTPGCVQRWLDHFDALGWQENKKHMLQWMAFTMRHPEKKINHIMILGGGEGNGKDFILYPLVRAMGRDSTTISGNELLLDFNEYLLSTKYLHINETELGDHNDSKTVANRLKPLATAPPYTLRVNMKGIRPVAVRNVVNVTMTTNAAVPIHMSADSRRYYAVWSDVSIRGENGEVVPEWQVYWDDRWKWIRDCEGWKHCVHYLMTQVDLSDFDPGRTPGVTDFVKEIQEASEDPISTAIKEMRRGGLSLMQSDLVTSNDIRVALKVAGVVGVSVDLKSIPNAKIIGKVMKQGRIGIGAKAWKKTKEVNDEFRVWIIRNHNKYAAMKGRELYEEYQRQMQEIRSGIGLKVVEG
jgi:hypothetical protein